MSESHGGIARALLVTLAALGTAGVLHAQDVYRAPPDSVFMLIVNPYHMYWVRGDDTVSSHSAQVTVETEWWRPEGSTLGVTVRQMTLDVNRTIRVDTIAISPLGVLQPNHRTDVLGDRVDFVPHLPGGALSAGRRWTDTVDGSHPGADKQGVYRVVRAYRVERLFDSAGMRLAELSAVGVAHYHDSWWADSAAGKLTSLDVTGPDSERVLFAVPKGRVVWRQWSMHLTGTGTLPSAQGTDTTPAGLIASETQTGIGAERAGLMTRALPGPDTSYTIDPRRGVVLMHTVRRGDSVIETSMIRNDGMVGTARTTYAGGAVVRYDALWTDTTAAPRRTTVTRVGDSLRVQDSGHPDTTMAIPDASWGIADYGMNAQLVPPLLTHARDTTAVPFVIYRPYPRTWDSGFIAVRMVDDNFVVTYRASGDSLATYFLITGDGDLLLGENGGPTGTQRVPPVGSARRAALDAILKAMR